LYSGPAITQAGGSVPDGNDQALLDRIGSDLHRMEGLEQTVPATHAQIQPTQNLEWVNRQFEGDPAMRRDYLQAAAAHPHLFREGETAIVSHVEPVVRHFAADDLTRRDYFRAVAADPSLLRQKPAGVIDNLEAVMQHYDADSPMRKEYVQAAVNQPALLRTPPEAVFAMIEATVDQLTAQGQTRRDGLAASPLPSTSLPSSTAPTPVQVADSSPLPSPRVQNPVLYVSYVDAPSRAR
jgi:hypothetical protein